MELLTIDWEALFQFESSVIELILRGVVLYFGILVLLRILPRRTGGELETMDLIFILLISEGASHSLGDYTSLTDGFIVIVTLLGCNYLVNALTYYFPAFEKLIEPRPLPIVKNGKLLRRNMRRELITTGELMEHLREEGLEDYKNIKIARVEADGKISIIKMEE